MLSKSFKPAKCKTSLRLAVARIKLLRNKRDVQVKQMKRELAQLLQNGQEQTARIRVEHVIREEKTSSAYELIELYCELIVARLPIIESQKTCPIDLKEAVSSVIFASPRCADVPELMDIRKHLTAKYGKEFTNAALEVRPDCGVSRLVVEKLSARAPDIGTKVKTLAAIAEEHDVKWDPKAFEEQQQKPHDDLLNVPASFAIASNTAKESSNVEFSNESSVKNMPQNARVSQPTMSSNFSETNIGPGPSVPPTSQPESRSSERKSGDRVVNNSSAREEHASLNRPAWNMEFQNAASAAQAAAESAERASVAARAAAEFASRENTDRQNFAGSNESPTHTTKYERPEQLRVFLDEHIADESVPERHDGSQEIKTVTQHDERTQGVSRREGDVHMARIAPIASSISSQTHVDTDILGIDLCKDDTRVRSRVHSISSKPEAWEQNHPDLRYENVDSGRENTNVGSIEAASRHVTDDDKIWNSNIYGHRNDEGETSVTDEGIFESSHKQLTSSGSFDVVFDNYVSDAEDDSIGFSRNRGNLLDPYQEEEHSSVYQHRSGSFAKNKGAKLHLFTESQPEEHSEAMSELISPLRNNEIVQPAFDASDGEETSIEDEVASPMHKETKTPSDILHDQRRSTGSSYSDESAHESNRIYMGEGKEIKEPFRNSEGYYEDKTETDLYAADKSSTRANLSSDHSSQPSARSEKAPIFSKVSVGGPGYSSSDEEPPPVRLTKRQPEVKETSMNLPSESSEMSNELSDGSGLGLNFGRLTGGFKQRGFPRPSFVRSSQTSESPPMTENPLTPDLDNQSTRAEVADQELYNQASRLKPYATKSRTLKASADFSSDTTNGLADKAKSIEDVDATAQGSYRQRYKEFSPTFRGSYDDPDITAIDSRDYRDTASMARKQSSDASPVTYASSEAINLEPYDQKPRSTGYKDPTFRMTNLDSSATDTRVDPNNTGGSRVKLSRRTRDVPSESKNSSSRVVEPIPNTSYDPATIQEKRGLKPIQSNPSISSESQPDAMETVVQTDDGSTKSSSSTGESVSGENSFKKASHTHPKLPDYDSLAARFHSLRSNRR